MYHKILKILFVFLIIIFSFFPYHKVSANELCSKNGYTILTINGIFTDNSGALYNRNKLAIKFDKTFNSQPLTVDYLYNPTHIAGAGDLIDYVRQGFFDEKSDYDLVEMLNDASQKITTQKVLLVAHSQGNFYANNFYDKVISKSGGIPSQSIGVYSIGTPASSVAGDGKYLTSDTDKVIASLVGGTLSRNILPPNTHIVLQDSDDQNGHDFSSIYLKYQGGRIVSDIKIALSKLKNNDRQGGQNTCLSPTELSYSHKIESTMLAVIDPTANAIKNGISAMFSTVSHLAAGVQNLGLSIKNGVAQLSANTLDSLPDTSVLATMNPDSLVAGQPDNFSKNPSLNTAEQEVVQNTANMSASVEEIPQTIPDQELITEADNTTPENNNSQNQNAPADESDPTAEIPAPDPYPGLLPGGGGVSTPTDSSGEDEPPAPTPSPDTPDITPPTITILGDNPATVVLNSDYFDEGASAQDDIEGEVGVVTSGEVDTSTIGTYVITYNASDSSGNSAETSRTVNVVEPISPPPARDTTAPVISILGDNPVSVTIGTTYSDAGAQAEDDVDGEVEVVADNIIDTSTIGSYIITYTATDSSGNAATAIRTVNIVPDDSNFSESDLNGNGIADKNEDEVVISSNESLSAGEYRFNNLIITDDAVLTLVSDPDSANSFKGVKINAANLQIDAGASISADKEGYGPDKGPGAGPITSIGASYGGLSYSNTDEGFTYGSAILPTELGSGGASLNHGGGAMYFVISNTLTNNGTISANGDLSGSGGSVFVDANNIAGTGSVRTNGGGMFHTGYYKSPGGGGRVAVYYNHSSFNGIVESKGGCGTYDSYTPVCGQDGTVGIFDRPNNDLYLNGSSWKFLLADGPFSFNNIYLSNGAKVTGENGVGVMSDNLIANGKSSLVLADNEILNIPSLTIDGNSTLVLSGSETITANNLTITGNSSIYVASEKVLSLTIPNIVIDAGSSISADTKGYGQNSGPGAPAIARAGASYGGLGSGNSPESLYGSETEPVDFGSGGLGRYPYGGGAIKIVADNSLVNNGIISANGNNTSSGGSIYVTAGALSGSGSFSANGGPSYCPNVCYGPGGGGRIAIYYQSSSFSGQTTVNGWSGYGGTSQPGTIHIVDASIPSPEPQSSEKAIVSFNFENLTPEVGGVIDEQNHTVSFAVPFGTDITALIPAIQISEKASIFPENNIVQDFSIPITYTVTAEDGSAEDYVVTVTIAPDPNPTPDTTPPFITEYTFNGASGDITTNPLENSISLSFTASENVDWVSVKIEREADPSYYKYFYPGDDCDGADTCTENWDGILSSGGLLQSGVYKIKIHIKDPADNEYDDYLNYVINISCG